MARMLFELDVERLYILPRWVGDTNFMTTTGESRVLPESLEMIYQRIKGAMES